MSEHELWNELGNLYFMSGSYEQAMHAYHRSIQMDRTYGKPYSNLAQTFVHQGKYAEAVMLFRRSLDLLMDNREKAISWNRLGKVYRQLKDYQQALIAFQRADELDPECKEESEQPGQMLYASSDLSNSFQEYSAPLADLGEDAASDLNKMPTEPTPEIATDAHIFTDISQPEKNVSISLETTFLTNWSDVDPDYKDSDWSPAFSDDAEIRPPSTDAKSLDKEFATPEEEPIDQSQQLNKGESQVELFKPASMELVNWQQAESQSFSHPSAKPVDLRETEYQVNRYAQSVTVDELPVASDVPVEKSKDGAIQTEEKPVQIKSRDKTPGVNSQEITDT